MPIRADEMYDGEITGGCLGYSSKGSLAINVEIECKDGRIQHAWYVTPKTRDRVKKTLLELGVPESVLASRTSLENIGTVLTGTKVQFNTLCEEYNGKSRVRVQWVNAPKKPIEGDPAKDLLKLFGDGMSPDPSPVPKSKGEKWDGMGISDEDIPF